MTPGEAIRGAQQHYGWSDAETLRAVAGYLDDRPALHADFALWLTLRGGEGPPAAEEGSGEVG